MVRGCGAPLGEAGKDNLLEFILQPSPSSSYRFIIYSYSVARAKVALSAYKRLVGVCFCISKNVPFVIRYHSISLRGVVEEGLHLLSEVSKIFERIKVDFLTRY